MGTLYKLFGIDLRALAAFRISLAAILLYDLWARSLDLTAHYTEHGVAPAWLIWQKHLLPGHWSIHLLFDSTAYQAILFLAAAAIYVALFLGYRTRLIAPLAWIMVVSLNNRNPIINNAADYLMAILLLWLLFLPAGARLSIDSAKSQPIRNSTNFLSPASAIILLQVLVVYFEAGTSKDVMKWLVDSSAVSKTFSLALYITPIGKLLSEILTNPQEQLLSRIIYYGEILVPFLVMFPFGTGAIRTVAALAFGILHLLLGLCMDLGAFGPVMAACWLLFLPSTFWHYASRAKRFLLTNSPKVISDSKVSSPPTPTPRLTLLYVHCALVLIFIYSIAISVPKIREALGPSYDQSNANRQINYMFLARILGLGYRWAVFPSPGDGVGQISVFGQYPEKVNVRLDVLGNKLAPTAPTLDTFIRFRWKKFFNTLLTRMKNEDQSLEIFCKRLCTITSPETPQSVEIYFSQVSKIPSSLGETFYRRKQVLCSPSELD